MPSCSGKPCRGDRVANLQSPPTSTNTVQQRTLSSHCPNRRLDYFNGIEALEASFQGGVSVCKGGMS